MSLVMLFKCKFWAVNRVDDINLSAVYQYSIVVLKTRMMSVMIKFAFLADSFGSLKIQ